MIKSSQMSVQKDTAKFDSQQWRNEKPSMSTLSAPTAISGNDNDSIIDKAMVDERLTRLKQSRILDSKGIAGL